MCHKLLWIKIKLVFRFSDYKNLSGKDSDYKGKRYNKNNNKRNRINNKKKINI